jgi:tetratricopeptide (TPR) repeat protein
LETSLDPNLVLAAAMIHFCAGDHEKAGPLFGKALSMDDKNDQARLLLFLIDWLADRSSASPYGQDLIKLDWRSPHEFFGYLVRVLEGKIAEDRPLRGGYTDQERHWLRYVAALIANRNHDTTKVESLLQPVVLTTGRENWLYFLAMARLEKTQQQKLASIDDPGTRKQYQEQLDQFNQKFQKSRPQLAERQALLAPLQAKLGQDSLAPEAKRALLDQILKIDPADGDLMVEMVFYCTMEQNWNLALEYARRFLSLDGRENAGRFQVGLLTAEILLNMGRKEEALAELENFLHNTEDAWYRSIAQCLLGRDTEKSLAEKAGESPEYVLTGRIALAFWAEGSGDKNKAINHYREALGSYMDNMIEYDFAVERIKRLRQKS